MEHIKMVYEEEEEDAYPFDEIPIISSNNNTTHSAQSSSSSSLSLLRSMLQQPQEEQYIQTIRASIEWLGSHVSKSTFDTIALQCYQQQQQQQQQRPCTPPSTPPPLSTESSNTTDTTKVSTTTTTMMKRSSGIPSLGLPYYTSHDAALLFVDISGFTRLATKLDTETLSQTINSYFHRILNHCALWGGDVLKFAGDAIFIQWKVDDANVNDDEKHSNGDSSSSSISIGQATMKKRITTLQDATTYAALCGASIVEDCSDYLVITTPSTTRTTTAVRRPRRNSNNSGTMTNGNSSHPDEYEDNEEDSIVLNVHCGIGAGLLAEIHVGGAADGNNDSRNSTKNEKPDTTMQPQTFRQQQQQQQQSGQRKELVMIGDPIDQVTIAESMACHGQLVASPQAMGLLSGTCDFFLASTSTEQDPTTPTTLPSNSDYPVIADGKQKFFNTWDKVRYTHRSVDASFRYTTSSENILNLLESDNINNGDDSASTHNGKKELGKQSSTQQDDIYSMLGRSGLERMRDELSLYVHRVVRSSELEATMSNHESQQQHDLLGASRTSMQSSVLSHLSASQTSCGRDIVRARHVSEAEIRSVYTIFIMPRVEAILSGNQIQDERLFTLLNDIMNVTNQVLFKFQGDLRQFIVDDKGVVLIATFGLRGSTFPNMVAERGLPATIAIHDALKVMLNVENHIGATLGQVYCGVVGGIFRHEFAVLGPSVNLAARLMCSTTNPGILVDQAVRLQSSKRFAFRTYKPVKAKGYTDLVPIYEPASSLDRQWKKITNSFVGRTSEIQEFRRVAKSILRSDSEQSPAKMVLLHAESGLGKSSVVYQSLTIIRQMAQMMHKRAQIAKSVANDENEQMVPFSGFRSVFLSVLTAYEPPIVHSPDQLHHDNESLYSASPSSKGSSFFLGMDDGSVDTASIGSSAGALIEKFAQLCYTMNRCTEWAETVGGTLLGLETIHEGSNLKVKSDEIVEFLADAFLKCTSRSHITVLALDDVQWMDAMTWKVLEALYNRAKNLLIIAISRPLSDYTLKLSDSFWDTLQSEQMNLSPRYTEMQLLPLEKADLRQLVANEWGVQPAMVDEHVCDDLFNQTGGMPYFASEICFELKRQGELVQDDSGSLNWKTGGKRGQWNHTRHAEEFLLFRFDKLGSLLRDILRHAALLGLEFSLAEISMVVSSSESSQSSLQDEESVRLVLQEAIQDNILIEVLTGIDSNEDNLDAEYEMEDEISYRFRHSLWRTCIQGTMLNEREREMHRYIASAYEAKYCFASGKDDTRFMLKAFSHWKGADEPSKATELAILIGKNFGNFGLNHQSLDLYNDAVNIWKAIGNHEDENKIPQKVLDKISATDLGRLIQIYTAIGQCHVNLLQKDLGTESFEEALSILENTPSASELHDRSVVFPIFSGLFVLSKGRDIKKEQHLVQRFVEEAELQGDPIHLCRALAMQADTLNRFGQVEDALEVQLRLTKLYNFDAHSSGICRAYGSDRAAQVFSSSALWLEQSGHVERAREVCEFVLNDLVPKMDPKNVHNAYVMIYPLLWVMKSQGMSLKARDIMTKFVVDAFNEHFDEGATTATKSTWKPVLILLELSGCEIVEDLDNLVKWALDEEGVNDFLNGAMGGISRDVESILAEICLLLSKLVANDLSLQSQLVSCGLKHAQKSEKVSRPDEGKTGYPNCYNMLKPVLNELQTLNDR